MAKCSAVDCERKGAGDEVYETRFEVAGMTLRAPLCPQHFRGITSLVRAH